MDVTAKLAEFVTDLNYEDIPRKSGADGKDRRARLPRRGARRQPRRGRKNLRRNCAPGKRQGGNQRHRSGIQDLRVAGGFCQRHRGARARLRPQFYADGPAHRADHSGDLRSGRSSRRERPSTDRSLRRRLRGHRPSWFIHCATARTRVGTRRARWVPSAPPRRAANCSV